MTYLSYDGQLRIETDADVIANLIRKGWVETPQPSYDPATQTCQWVDGAWAVADIVVPVPDRVPMWALREAVMQAGQKAAIEAAMNALPEPDRSIAWNRWEYKDVILRQSAIILSLQSALGWTSEYVDDLYKSAEAIAASPA